MHYQVLMVTRPIPTPNSPQLRIRWFGPVRNQKIPRKHRKMKAEKKTVMICLWIYGCIPKKTHWIHHNADVYGFMDAIYHMSIASRNPKKTSIRQFCTATKSCMKRPSACVATTFFFLSRQTYRIQCPLSLLESVQMGQFDLLADNFAGRFNEMIVTFPNQPTISTWKISHLHTTWAPHKVGLKGWLPQFLSSISDLQKNAQTSSILAAHVNRDIGLQS